VTFFSGAVRISINPAQAAYEEEEYFFPPDPF
jgi:hypothetical protein